MNVIIFKFAKRLVDFSRTANFIFLRTLEKFVEMCHSTRLESLINLEIYRNRSLKIEQN